MAAEWSDDGGRGTESIQQVLNNARSSPPDPGGSQDARPFVDRGLNTR
jgi:hypothetical protein